jgi:hypothetical protein
MLAAALAVVLMTASVGAKARDVAIIGAGSDSCGTWTAQRQNTQGPSNRQWILGFISGAAFYGEGNIDPLNERDAQAVWAWVDNWCQNNPLEPMVMAGKGIVTLTLGR